MAIEPSVPSGTIFLDTSILVGGVIELGTEQSEAALALLDAVAAGRFKTVQTAWHCCLEFYSVITRLPDGFRVAPAEALRLVEQEILRRLEIHRLPEADSMVFFRNAVKDGIAGGRIYDAHIAEVARCAGAGIVVTENRRHFMTSLRHGLRVLTAAEMLDAAGLR